MRYLKTIGMLAVAATALMALASSASAGSFSIEKNGPAWTGEIHATAGETTFHGVVTITCLSSTTAGSVVQHGSGVTGKVSISTWTFSECGPIHPTVFSSGSLEVHTHPADAAGGTYGIVTSSGLTLTFQVTSLGLTCGYRTENTEIGTLTTSTHRQVTGDTQTTPQIHVDSVALPRHSGSVFCGSSAEWTGTYTITTPDYLDYT